MVFDDPANAGGYELSRKAGVGALDRVRLCLAQAIPPGSKCCVFY
jgi:hypothetical protein